jgi:two-component system, chemotaxis family, protein-glutamate methylesterase/glutaminase
MSGFALAVLGTSWGGLNALSTIVRGFPKDLAVPVAVVQHRGRETPSLLRDLLREHTDLAVSEIEDKQPFAPGHIYLAPADYHLLIEPGYFSLSTEPAVRYSRPSIDVTFSSAADALGAAVIGVVLTGANRDGSLGLRRIADRGGHAVVQHPETAESPLMPRAAFEMVPDADLVRLDEIGPHVTKLAAVRAGGPRRSR